MSDHSLNCRHGHRHGLFRRFGSALSRSDNLLLVAFFLSGKPVGRAWKGLTGGAYLVGALEEKKDVISGKDCVYIYPDLNGNSRFKNLDIG